MSIEHRYCSVQKSTNGISIGLRRVEPKCHEGNTELIRPSDGRENTWA
jgi:hypothetical protein